MGFLMLSPGTIEKAVATWSKFIPGTSLEVNSRFENGDILDGRVTIMNTMRMGICETKQCDKEGFKMTPAFSIMISVDTQEEIDTIYDGFVENGGKAQPCGWLTDAFGLHWQVVPKNMKDLMGSGNAAKDSAAQSAMFKMKKLIIEDLVAARDAVE